jgi:simple sugar transport system ATP-binding protein
LVNGEATHFATPLDALNKGVGMLYQDPLDFPPFRVIDNYLMGKNRRVQLDYRAASRELLALTRRYGFEVELEAFIDTLSVGERQQLELVRLLAGGAEFLILDEPTTGISAEQKELLFASMRRMAGEEGKTLILVSHKLDEVQELCDEVYVLRRGVLAGQTAMPCPNEKLVKMMFGGVPRRKVRPALHAGEPVLELRDVRIDTYRIKVAHINLIVKAGEIFGLAGLEGSGQHLVQMAGAGLIAPSGGRVFLEGRDVTHVSYHQRRGIGVAYVSAGRLEEGLVAGLSLTEHVLLAEPQRRFMIDWEAAQRETGKRITAYEVIGAPATYAEELSGGNQQRLLLGLLNPGLKLLLLQDPTRGLDVRSTEYIWERMYERRADGTAIMFASADLDEIIERSDRISVFSGGVMSRVVHASETSVDELGHLIGGEQ